MTYPKQWADDPETGFGADSPASRKAALLSHGRGANRGFVRYAPDDDTAATFIARNVVSYYLNER